jgi:DNA-binding IscR family transcriptional regulator
LAARYFDPILQGLSGGGILTASRGKLGGYQLARTANLITADDVLRAVRATQDIAAGKNGSSIATSIVLPVLEGAQMAFAKALQDITIADLVVRSAATGSED